MSVRSDPQRLRWPVSRSARCRERGLTLSESRRWWKSGDSRVAQYRNQKSIPIIEQSPEPQRRHAAAGSCRPRSSATACVRSFDWRLQLVRNWRPDPTVYLTLQKDHCDHLAGQGFGVDGGFQSCRLRPFASRTIKAAGGVSGRLFRRCRCRADIGPSPRPLGRVDRQQARGYGTHDRSQVDGIISDRRTCCGKRLRTGVTLPTGSPVLPRRHHRCIAGRSMTTRRVL